MIQSPAHHRYDSFLKSPFGRAWAVFGPVPRAGAVVPLFSVYSGKSVGVGDFADVRLLVDWCAQTGITLLQFLPLNDAGYGFRPYDAESALALDPAYLSLDELKADLRQFRGRIDALRSRFAKPGAARVDWRVKKEKMDLLERIHGADSPVSSEMRKFAAENGWLRSYALYKVLKEKYGQRSWEEWPGPLRAADPSALAQVEKEDAGRIAFYEWLQWQLYEQFRAAHDYARAKGIFLIGDLPFLVSRDSADVWAHQSQFKLGYAAGAPPDLYFSEGQKWGMPPYDWARVAEDGYGLWTEKLKYAEHFYDSFRIDHFVGLFRLWTVPRERESAGGFFDPSDEKEWESHGTRLLDVIAKSTRLLPCAEDLGTVPECSYRVLSRYAVPGMDVQRWTKRDWPDYSFKDPAEYRPNSVATVSTHDMPGFAGWWTLVAGTVDEGLFRKKCAAHGITFEPLAPKLFERGSAAPGRLRWKRELTRDDYLWAVGKHESEIGDLVSLFESTHEERQKFWEFAGLKGVFEPTASARLLRAALEAAHRAASVFSVQLVTDWLGLSGYFLENPMEAQINFPGTVDEKNWSLRLPLALEEMGELAENQEIRRINTESGRLPAKSS